MKKVLEILDSNKLSEAKKIDAALSLLQVSPKLSRLFAVACARSVQHLMTDERCIKALDVADRFAHGLATRDELEAAHKEISSLAWETTMSADESGRAAKLRAVRAAAWVPDASANDEMYTAALDAAREAAEEAERAERAAVRDAVRAAREAVRAVRASQKAGREARRSILRALIIANPDDVRRR